MPHGAAAALSMNRSISLLALLLAGGLPAAAKQLPVRLAQLIAESDLIYVARPQMIERCPYPRICAEAVVVPAAPSRVFKGSPAAKTRLQRSDDFHDQSIGDFSEHLLFLKRGGRPDEAGWTAASYGRSYIRLEEIHRAQVADEAALKEFGGSETAQGFFLKNNPLIEFPAELVVKVRVAHAYRYPAAFESVDAVLLTRLERFVRERRP